MDEELDIIYLKNKEKITKFNMESLKRFNQRIKFIQLLESEGVKWKDAQKLSKIWYNITFNDCKYSPQIYRDYLKYNKEYLKNIKNI